VNKAVHVVVIGGGISGLAAAFSLKQAVESGSLAGGSIRCTVLEADRRFGGKILSHREAGFILERGPDSMLARKPAGVGLVRALGIESELVGMNPKAHKTYVLSRGRLRRLPPGTNMGIPARWDALWGNDIISAGGKWRALRDLVLPPLDASGDISLGYFLRRRLGGEWVDRLCEPLLAGIYAGDADRLSLDATFPQFRRLEAEYGSLMLGSAAQLRRQPESLIRGGRSAFVSLRGGLATLIERLYDHLHPWADLRTDTRVESLSRDTDGRFQVYVRDRDGAQALTADAVVLTVPAFVAADLLQPLVTSAESLRAIEYVSSAVVGLVFRSDELHTELDASGFIIPRMEGRSITASTWFSSKWPHTAPPGYTLIRCFVGRSGQVDELSLDDDDMVTLVRRELADIIGITATPQFAQVTRWPQSMPQYQVGHLQMLATVEQELATAAPGLFLAGAGYRGVGIPDCIAQAQAAVKQVISHLNERLVRAESAR
jgi:oxygen-dependent protoporphyrinogen oxidase